MFIVSLTYIQPLEKIEEFLDEHRTFLDKFYQQGKFLMSGRKEPRTGGIIIMNAKDLDEVNQIIEQDPFHQHKIADYQVIEFYPSKVANGLEKYQQTI